MYTMFRINFYRIRPFSDEDEVSTKAQPNQEAEKKKKLINQFNYCERAVLTLNNPPRVIKITSIQYLSAKSAPQHVQEKIIH